MVPLPLRLRSDGCQQNVAILVLGRHVFDVFPGRVVNGGQVEPSIRDASPQDKSVSKALWGILEESFGESFRLT